VLIVASFLVAEDHEVSRKEKAKRRYSMDMYQHTMGMWQTMATDLK
jgi:hypothetical protein